MRSIFTLLFHCQHKRISGPITLSTKPGVPQADTYVVCLDCGDQFSYDWNRMRIGERIERPRPTTY
jgi:hypothetical protein